MNFSISKDPDISRVNILESTKVRVLYSLKDGIIVTHYRDNRLGFIPNKQLKTSKELLFTGKELYVFYLGLKDQYLSFAEGDSLEEALSQN